MRNNRFTSFGGELSFRDYIQCDGAFATAHINYGKSPIFNGLPARDIALSSREGSISSVVRVRDVIGELYEFDGTEKGLSDEDRRDLWKNYFSEYVNAFDTLAYALPGSVITTFIARHAAELGLKYLLLMKNNEIPKTHNLGELAYSAYYSYEITDDYMQWVDTFCREYCRFIEGENAEYFRYPEYKEGSFFAGNSLDIEWLSYNFALVLLKLVHFAGLDDEL